MKKLTQYYSKGQSVKDKFGNTGLITNVNSKSIFIKYDNCKVKHTDITNIEDFIKTLTVIYGAD